MAVGRGGASSSATLAIAILACGFIVCLLLAVFFYSQFAGATTKLGEADQRLREVATTAELQSPEVQGRLNAEDAGDASVLGVMLAELSELETELASREARLREFEQEAAQARERAAQLESARVEEAQRAEQANAALAAARGEFDAAAGTLGEKLQASTASLSSVDTAASERFGDLSRQFEEERTQLRGQIDELRARVNELTTLTEEQSDDLERLGRLEEVRISEATLPDAEVLEVVEEGRRLTLGVGRRQNVRRGMTFTVYSPDELLRLEGNSSLPGKGVVEVFQIYDDTSVARLVEPVRNRRPVVGDAVVNLVYDPDRRYRLLVYGEFDIDQSGNPSPREREQVEAMVRRFGGDLADELSYDVDYLVLGVQPAPPEELVGSDRRDTLKIEQANEAQRRFDDYNALVSEARALGIPVLNQNRFLSLVGYYER